jgi:hypothetical protein
MSDNRYEPSSTEDARREESNKPQARPLAASIGLGVAIFLASGIAFCATCTVGVFVGTRASPAVSEQAMGHGLMTGVIVGIICGLTVAVLLSRLLFRRERGEGAKE